MYLISYPTIKARDDETIVYAKFPLKTDYAIGLTKRTFRSFLIVHQLESVLGCRVTRSGDFCAKNAQIFGYFTV